jgi:hypothetical protein
MLVIQELNSVAFVDQASGRVRRVEVPTGEGAAAAAGSDAAQWHGRPSYDLAP